MVNKEINLQIGGKPSEVSEWSECSLIVCSGPNKDPVSLSGKFVRLIREGPNLNNRTCECLFMIE